MLSSILHWLQDALRATCEFKTVARVVVNNDTSEIGIMLDWADQHDDVHGQWFDLK
jgi:hypothetical protein